MTKLKKLLLHSCCAPCSSGALEQLLNKYDITIYFYNPNINTKKEHDLRAQSQINLCEILNIPYIIERYTPSEFDKKIIGREQDTEGGKRCQTCYHLRLDKTATFAKENGYDIFTTTLSVSPYKNATLLNQLGESISKKYGVKYLSSDFKKNDGYLKSINNSKKYALYRQNFCGCEYSVRK